MHLNAQRKKDLWVTGIGTLLLLLIIGLASACDCERNEAGQCLTINGEGVSRWDKLDRTYPGPDIYVSQEPIALLDGTKVLCVAIGPNKHAWCKEVGSPVSSQTTFSSSEATKPGANLLKGLGELDFDGRSE